MPNYWVTSHVSPRRYNSSQVSMSRRKNDWMNEKVESPLARLPLKESSKNKCPHCQSVMGKKEREFLLYRIDYSASMTVREHLLYCQRCNRYFASQKISKALSKAYPGYMLIAAVYSPKRKTYNVYQPVSLRLPTASTKTKQFHSASQPNQFTSQAIKRKGKSPQLSPSVPAAHQQKVQITHNTNQVYHSQFQVTKQEYDYVGPAE